MVNIDRKGAGAEGWKFVFFSAIFYLFIGTIITLGAGSWMIAVSTPANNVTIGNYSTNVTSTSDFWNVSQYLLQNPFSTLGWLAWLSIAIAICDVYIIVTSLIP